ncbi:unnamed protein product [Linum trigynum]|uniref:MORF/ORRM1/DAG-like MORF domain-containing protein n=1 Tax=Linum trigynum TaxID=586398 RepID=A0AAV2C8J0_9ROSI
MTEEESEKFADVPGVVYVLPDSYLDPVNKEYGGDKYENGVITHRPPPVMRTRRYGEEGGGSPQGGAGGRPGYPGEGQGFSQRNTQEGQRDYNNPMDQSGNHQVRERY